MEKALLRNRRGKPSRIKVCKFKVLQVTAEYIHFCGPLFPCRYEALGKQQYAVSFTGIWYIKCYGEPVFVSRGRKEKNPAWASHVCKVSHTDSFCWHPKRSIKIPPSKTTSNTRYHGNLWNHLSFLLLSITQLCSLRNPTRNLMHSRISPLHLCSLQHTASEPKGMVSKYHHLTIYDLISLVHAKHVAEEKLQTKWLTLLENKSKVKFKLQCID